MFTFFSCLLTFLLLRWVTDSPFLVLPHIEPHMLYLFRKKGLHAIPQLWDLCQNQSIEPLAKILRPEMDENMIDSVFEALQRLPKLHVELNLALGDRPPFALPKRSGKEHTRIKLNFMFKKSTFYLAKKF